MKYIRIATIDCKSSPASHSGHLVVIVGGGGGQTDGGHHVTEGDGAGQLDNGKVKVIALQCVSVVWMVIEFTEKIRS